MITMHLRCLLRLNPNISYANVYVTGVYIVYSCVSGQKQGQMLNTCINSITDNLTVAHLYIHLLPLWNQKSARIHYFSQLILTQTNQVEKLSNFLSKILFNIILPYEWFIFFSGLWNKIMQVSLVRWNITLKEMYR